MTAAAVTKAFCYNMIGMSPVCVKFYKAAATDFVDTSQLTPAMKGFMPFNGFSISATAATALPAMQWGQGRMAATTTAAATSLSVDEIIPYVAGYARTPPYYILAADAGTTAFEIMEVTADSAPATATSTLTVVRGCFGTTAAVAGVTDESYIYFLNILYLTDSTIGTCIVYGMPLPQNNQAKLFA